MDEIQNLEVNLKIISYKLLLVKKSIIYFTEIIYLKLWLCYRQLYVNVCQIFKIIIHEIIFYVQSIKILAIRHRI
jgi:hypothetical protein